MSKKLHDEDASAELASTEKDDLSDVFDELFDARSQRKLKELQIQSLETVLARRDDFKDEAIEGLRKSTQKQLHQFCLWYEEFFTKNDKSISWRAHFTADHFDSFVEQLGKSPDGDVNLLFEHARRMLHEGKPGDLADLTDKKRNDLYAYVVRKTMEELPPKLIEECNFDVKNFIIKCVRAIFNIPSGDPYPKILLVAGRTQSGKTNVKAVVLTTCNVLRCPLKIITKGVAESQDLKQKITHKVTKYQDDFEAWWEGQQYQPNRFDVLADTAAKINNKAIVHVEQLRKFKKDGKFALIIDECDAMYRTEEGSQKFEQAYDDLMSLKPALRIEISATPIPALFALTEQGHAVEILELGTADDYAGVTAMKPLEGSNGKPLFLSVEKKSKLRYDDGVSYEKIKNGLLKGVDPDLIFPEEESNDKFNETESRVFSKCDELEFIPFTDAKVMQLYEDALADSKEGQPKKQGVLLLDCTNSRVTADMNNFQKAACVQNHFQRRNKQVVIVVVVGGGIYVRRPGFLHGRFIPNRKTVSDVIERLDELLGLDMPIFVFGYSKMRRCISYRSERRVPTHMVLYLGLGYSNENYVQAIGRATFNGLETVLKANGLSHVTVLTLKNDFSMAHKYTKFVSEVSQRLKTGATVAEVMSDGKKLFSDAANYLLHTNRKTGQIKGHKHLLPEQRMFEDPIEDDSGDDSGDDSADYSHEDTSKRILRALLDLIHDSLPVDFETLPNGKDRSDGDGHASIGMKSTDASVDESVKVVVKLENEAGGGSMDDNSDQENQETFENINKKGFTGKQILTKYNSTYQDGAHTLKSNILNTELTQLKNQAKIEKIENGRWRAKNLRALKLQFSYDF
ncbi:expressed unknown protein [Seminavis robusta]|uniref:Uncharacterized protein n=1 Tax=Seminavis robusta TaxID=568900 RepID=A0A9N8E214_9STRA|nr:expressed unknown protein [Seminavis robusta]|eukprot:Sro451_g145690.1 n/a (854) ;mRNA; r:25543-28104